MEIRTEFDIDDEIYYIDSNIIKRGFIRNWSFYGNSTEVIYYIGNNTTTESSQTKRQESEIGKTPEELFKKLLCHVKK